MPLRGYQTQHVENVYGEWDKGHKNVMGVNCVGSGKCVRIDTPILMFDGTVKPVQNVTEGDLLMGPDSKPRRVLSLARGKELMYEVKPVKGDCYYVNASHILSLKKTPRFPGDKHIIVNINVEDYLKLPVWKQKDLKGWRTGVDFSTIISELKIAPYILGVWLGDGHANGFSITNGDFEIIQEFISYVKSFGLYCNIDENSPGSVTICATGRRVIKNVLRQYLYDYNLYKNKHIPHVYKTASRQDRLQLLAGILDTDGHYDTNGCYDIVFKSERVMDDTIFLARSLGLAAYKKACKKTCHNNGVVGDYFRCTISGNLDQIPCRVERQKAKPRKQPKDVLVTGINVTLLGIEEYYGFTIDGDHLFILGDFTVTHNTEISSEFIRRNNGHALAIAHRKELVDQMSLSIARHKIKHKIITNSSQSIRALAELHRQEFNGECFIDMNSTVAVGGTKSILTNRLYNPKDTTLLIVDEAHHVTADNEWGQVCAMHPHARGFFPTATPARTDKKRLGRQYEGVIDSMVIGPSMGDQIHEGYITDYRLFGSSTLVDVTGLAVSNTTGDFNQKQADKVLKDKSIVGDIYDTWAKHAKHAKTIIFASSLEEAEKYLDKFKSQHIKTAIISGTMLTSERIEIMRKYRKGELQILINIDVLGEGVDVPDVECVVFARLTQSLILMTQQTGRCLRLFLNDEEKRAHAAAQSSIERKAIIAASKKPNGIVIDMVGNIARLLPPDVPRLWSLGEDSGRVKSEDSLSTVTYCTNVKCLRLKPRYMKKCPHCGHENQIITRSIESVAGDVIEYPRELLNQLKGRIDEIMGEPVYPWGAQPHVIAAIDKQWKKRLEALKLLRDSITLWRDYNAQRHIVDSDAYRYFYMTYGVDVLSAQLLTTNEMHTLARRITSDNINLLSNI